MRAATNLIIRGVLAFSLSIAAGACGKFKQNDPAAASKARAEVKREQAACGSPAAYDRVKGSIFDQAIAERPGDRTSLDTLADYSAARMENPVVMGWDPSLDLTRCKGRFILEVPPGAERALGGERRLQSDIEYTAQASADGAGLVYQQKGAELMVAKLASFNLSPVAYRPPPAIDQDQPGTQVADQTVKSPARVVKLSPSAPPNEAAPAPARRQESLPRTAPAHTRIADRGPLRPRTPLSSVATGGTGEATVRAFYGALGAGNGSAAASQVIPEKRSGGAYSPGAMSRFYGRLPEPIRLTSLAPLAAGTYRVTYHYSAGRSRCNGSAVVRMTNRGGHNLISSIRSLSGC